MASALPKNRPATYQDLFVLVEVLKLSGQEWIIAGTFGGEGEARVPPFNAVAIDLGASWDAPSTVTTDGP